MTNPKQLSLEEFEAMHSHEELERAANTRPEKPEYLPPNWEDKMLDDTPTPECPVEADPDNTVLTFGKHRGKTPEQLSNLDPHYIVWAYETIKDKVICSDAMYRFCKAKPKPNHGRNR